MAVIQITVDHCVMQNKNDQTTELDRLKTRDQHHWAYCESNDPNSG